MNPINCFWQRTKTTKTQLHYYIYQNQRTCSINSLMPWRKQAIKLLTCDSTSNKWLHLELRMKIGIALILLPEDIPTLLLCWRLYYTRPKTSALTQRAFHYWRCICLIWEKLAKRTSSTVVWLCRATLQTVGHVTDASYKVPNTIFFPLSAFAAVWTVGSSALLR